MKLAAFLKLPGQSATAIARKCGVSASSISRAARGEMDPSIEMMHKIRKATDGAVRADDFLPPFVEQAHQSSSAQA